MFLIFSSPPPNKNRINKNVLPFFNFSKFNEEKNNDYKVYRSECSDQIWIRALKKIDPDPTDPRLCSSL